MNLSACPKCWGTGTPNLDKPSSWRISDTARLEAARDQELSAGVSVSGFASGTPGRFYVEKKA